jgi:hypothetical protein
MAKVIVYPFTVYDIHSEQRVLSTRMGTLEGIERLRKFYLANPYLDQGVEIDASRLEADGIPGFPELTGLTPLDFKP